MARAVIFENVTNQVKNSQNITIMKKIIVLIALVAFIGVTAAPLSAAYAPAAVEQVKEKKDDKKSETKKSDAKKSDKECAEKSDCCKSKCTDKSKDKDPEKK